jgi:hypothetical protein
MLDRITGGGNVKEKPIIFSTPMVQAILDGRKTQTRRVVKPQPEQGMKIIGPEWFEPTAVDRNGEEVPGKPIFGIYADEDDWGLKVPYQPGDILWVRETWMPETEQGILTGGYIYKASNNRPEPDGELPLKWKPSIHMPREATRIFLKVKAVRVERVQDITEKDARAEGAAGYIRLPDEDDTPFTLELSPLKDELHPRIAFRYLWDSLNAKRGYSWDSNPWVWVIEFERVEVQS